MGASAGVSEKPRFWSQSNFGSDLEFYVLAYRTVYIVHWELRSSFRKTEFVVKSFFFLLSDPRAKSVSLPNSAKPEKAYFPTPNFLAIYH